MRLPEPKKLPSGNWRIQVLVGGKRVGRTFHTKEEAEYWAAGLKTKSTEDSVPSREVTVKRAFQDYIDSRDKLLSPATLQSYKNVQANYFSSLMPRKASSIKRADV